MQSKTPILLLCIVAVAFVISVIVLSPDLPSRIATHFDGSGQANGWMSHRQHLIVISVIGIGLPALIIGICFLHQVFAANCYQCSQCYLLAI